MKRSRGFRSPWLGVVACLGMAVASCLQCFGLLPGSNGIAVAPDKTLPVFAGRFERAVLGAIGQDGSEFEESLGLPVELAVSGDPDVQLFTFNQAHETSPSFEGPSSAQPNPYYQ